MQTRLLLLLLLTTLVAGCAQVPDKAGGHYEYFNISSVAKSDIDMVEDKHFSQTIKQLKLLTEKLYKRNPKEWKKSRFSSRDAAIKHIFTRPYPAVEGKRSVDSIRLAFDPNYNGDRVLAYIAGLASMVGLSYNDKADFYLFDELDAQKLYNSARNIEIASWLLRTKKNRNGQLYLLSAGQNNSSTNAGYERLFGKMIGQQDTLALIVATTHHRTIKNAIQSAAQLVFLPV